MSDQAYVPMYEDISEEEGMFELDNITNEYILDALREIEEGSFKLDTEKLCEETITGKDKESTGKVNNWKAHGRKSKGRKHMYKKDLKTMNKASARKEIEKEVKKVMKKMEKKIRKRLVKKLTKKLT